MYTHNASLLNSYENETSCESLYVWLVTVQNATMLLMHGVSLSSGFRH